MTIYLFATSMVRKYVVVSLELDSYFVDKTNVKSLLEAFGFTVRVSGFLDPRKWGITEFFPESKVVASQIIVNDEAVITCGSDILNAHWRAVIPLEGYYLYCIGLTTLDIMAYVWILCERGSFKFCGSHSSRAGVRCIDTVEMANLLINGVIKELS